jgi:lipopolysaccharide export system protein LptA
MTGKMRKEGRFYRAFDAHSFRMGILVLMVILMCLVLVSGIVHAEKKLDMDKNQPIHIQSDRLDAYQEKRVVIFSGNAIATQGDRTIQADQLHVYYKDSPDGAEKKDAKNVGAAGDLERLEAHGRVNITETNRIVTGDHAVFYQDLQKIEMTGNAMMREGKNMIKGGKITVYLKEDRGVVESSESKRVTATIYPNENKEDGRK